MKRIFLMVFLFMMFLLISCSGGKGTLPAESGNEEESTNEEFDATEEDSSENNESKPPSPQNLLVKCEDIISLLDLNNPAEPEVLVYLIMHSTVHKFYSDGRYIFSTFDSNLEGYTEAISIFDTESMEFFNNLNLKEYARSVIRIGNYLYVAQDSNDIVIYDLSNMNYLKGVRRIQTAGDYIGEFKVYSNYLFVANGSGGVSIFDISNPAEPDLVTGKIPADIKFYNVRYINIINGYLVVNNDCNLLIIDISDVFNPILVYEDKNAHACGDIVSYKNFLLVPQWEMGLRIYDYSDRELPESRTLLEANKFYRIKNVAVSGSFAYVPDEDGKLAIVDISDILRPNIINRIDVCKGKTASTLFAY